MAKKIPLKELIKSALADGAKVVTIKDVKVLRKGTWSASTGVTTVTDDDLKDMVAASVDPEMDLAVLKLGHVDPLNADVFKDGAPSLGHFTNLRVDGEYLVADITDVPVPFAQVMAHAYKRRSAEIAWSVRMPSGNRYRAALTAVALLGKVPPAAKGLGDIESVDDLYELYGIEKPEVKEEVAAFTADLVSALATGEEGGPLSELAEAINIDRIREAWREEHPRTDSEKESEIYPWVKEVWLEPGTSGGYLIIDGAEDLKADEAIRVAWEAAEDGAITFGDEEKVQVTYSPAALTARTTILEQRKAGKIDAPTAQTLLSAIAAPISGGNPPGLATPPDNDHNETTTPPKEAAGMDEKRLKELLEMEDETAALETFKSLRAESKPDESGGTTDPEKPEGETATETPEPASTDAEAHKVEVEDGLVKLTEGTWEGVQSDLTAGREARKILRDQEIQTALSSATRGGRIAADPDEQKAWRERLDKDFEGTKALLSSLKPRFSTQEIGDDNAAELDETKTDEAVDSFLSSTFGIDKEVLTAIDQGGN